MVRFTKRIDRAVKELDKEMLFWGNIPDTLEKNKLYEREDAKEVMDKLNIRNTKIRSFVYDQMELRRRQKLKEVVE